MPSVRLTWGNCTSNSLDRSLARNNRASLADVLLSSEVPPWSKVTVLATTSIVVQGFAFIIHFKDKK